MKSHKCLPWEKVFLRFFFGWQMWACFWCLVWVFDLGLSEAMRPLLTWIGSIMYHGLAFSSFMLFVQVRKSRPPSDL